MALINKKKRPTNIGLASEQVMEQAPLREHTGETKSAVKRVLIAFHEDNDYRELDTEESIRSLAENIRLNGLSHNLVLTRRRSTQPGQQDKQYVLLSGERRLRAINLLCAEHPEENARFAVLPSAIIPEEKFQPSEEFFARAEAAGQPATEENYRHCVEMIYIDTANLQQRGGTGDPTQTAKAMNRYMENVQLVYGLTEKQARAQLLELVGKDSERVVWRNIQLYKGLLPELYDLFTSRDSDLSKEDFLKFTELEPLREQQALYKAADNLSKQREALGDMYPTRKAELRQKAAEAAAQPADEARAQGLEDFCREFIARLNSDTAPAPAPAVTATDTPAVSAREERLRKDYDAFMKTLARTTKSMEQRANKRDYAKQVRGLGAGEQAALLAQLDALTAAAAALRDEIRGAD